MECGELMCIRHLLGDNSIYYIYKSARTVVACKNDQLGIC